MLRPGVTPTELARLPKVLVKASGRQRRYRVVPRTLVPHQRPILAQTAKHLRLACPGGETGSSSSGRDCRESCHHMASCISRICDEGGVVLLADGCNATSETRGLD